MKDPAKLHLWTLAALCVLAFIAFVTAGALDPADRGALDASATAFLVGAVLAIAAGRAHAAQARRLQALERRLEALEGGRRLAP